MANSVTLESVDWARFVMRSLWLVAALVVGSLLWNGLRRGRMALEAQGELAGRQAERRRALDALHNVVLQSLTGIERRAANPGAGVGAAIDEIGKESRRRAADVKALLETQGEGDAVPVMATLRRLATELEGGGGIRVELTTQGPEPLLAPDAADALAGAVGEALRNARDHSGSTSVVVGVCTAGDRVRATVRDDGSGFDPTAAAEDYGIPDGHPRADRGGRRFRSPGHPSRPRDHLGAGGTVQHWRDASHRRGGDRGPGGTHGRQLRVPAAGLPGDGLVDSDGRSHRVALARPHPASSPRGRAPRRRGGQPRAHARRRKDAPAVEGPARDRRRPRGASDAEHLGGDDDARRNRVPRQPRPLHGVHPGHRRPVDRLRKQDARAGPRVDPRFAAPIPARHAERSPSRLHRLADARHPGFVVRRRLPPRRRPCVGGPKGRCAPRRRPPPRWPGLGAGHGSRSVGTGGTGHARGDRPPSRRGDLRTDEGPA